MKHVCRFCGVFGEENFYKGYTRICKRCHTDRRIKKRELYKLMVYKYKGGKCEHCGYSEWYGALDLHHIEPTGDAKTRPDWRGMSFDRMIEYSDQCLLICTNCHRELTAIEQGWYREDWQDEGWFGQLYDLEDEISMISSRLNIK